MEKEVRLGVGLVPESEGLIGEELIIMYRNERREQSARQGEIVDLGTLQGETPSEHWTGSISLKERLDRGEVTEEELNQVPDRLNENFVEAGKDAPKRCVDGRTVKDFIINAASWFKRKLGVQVQGGSSGDAIGRRLAKGYEQGATLVGDVKALPSGHKSKFTLGGHIDDHAEGAKTGCGAVDGQERKNDIEVNAGRFTTLSKVIDSIYQFAGLPIPLDFFRRLQNSAKSLNQNKETYFSDTQNVTKVIEEQNPEGVEEVVGPHNEISLTLNMVEGTTFDKDAYNSLTNDKLHNFNLDVWSIIEEHGEDASFVIADAVATVLDLTDGSLKLYARIPKRDLSSGDSNLSMQEAA